MLLQFCWQPVQFWKQLDCPSSLKVSPCSHKMWFLKEFTSLHTHSYPSLDCCIYPGVLLTLCLKRNPYHYFPSKFSTVKYPYKNRKVLLQRQGVRERRENKYLAGRGRYPICFITFWVLFFPLRVFFLLIMPTFWLGGRGKELLLPNFAWPVSLKIGCHQRGGLQRWLFSPNAIITLFFWKQKTQPQEC